MISIIRNKHTGHVYAPQFKAAKEREQKEREKEREQQLYDDIDSGRLEYGRRMPIRND